MLNKKMFLVFMLLSGFSFAKAGEADEVPGLPQNAPAAQVIHEDDDRNINWHAKMLTPEVDIPLALGAGFILGKAGRSALQATSLLIKEGCTPDSGSALCHAMIWGSLAYLSYDCLFGQKDSHLLSFAWEWPYRGDTRNNNFHFYAKDAKRFDKLTLCGLFVGAYGLRNIIQSFRA